LAVGQLVLEAESDEGGLEGDVRLVIDPESCWLYPGDAGLPEDIKDLLEVAS
jgi:hypothetical protein